MALDKIFNGGNIDNLADNVLNEVDDFMLSMEKIQQRKIASNVQLVVQALKKIDSDIRAKYDGVTSNIDKRVSTIKDGKDGINGRDGRDGKDGRPGKDGAAGPRGLDGAPGRDGMDGMDGVSVTGAKIDFDGSLVISLSSGQEINVGEVVAPDLADRIKVITNGGGTSQSVLDTLVSLQAQITLMQSSVTVTTATTLTPNVATAGFYAITALATGLAINAPTGSPVAGTKLTIRIQDDGTSRALTWDATYTVIGTVLPTATVANKTLYVGCIYNADQARWDVVAVSRQA